MKTLLGENGYVADDLYVEQESLYFQTAAMGRGVLYYHALSLITLPLIALVAGKNITNITVFSTILFTALVLHSTHLVAFFFAKPLFARWALNATSEAVVVSALCYFSGGVYSDFRYLLFLLILFSIVKLCRSSTYLTGAVSIFAIGALLNVTDADSVLLAKDAPIFCIFLFAAAISSAEIANFISTMHTRSIANIVSQVNISRKVAEQRDEIQSQGKKYRSLLETVNAIPWEYDRHSGYFTYIGPQAANAFSYPLQDWVSKERFLVEITHEDDKAGVTKILSSITQGGREDTDIEFRIRSAEGGYKWVFCSVTSGEASNNERYVNGVMFDETDRKLAAIELDRYRERLEEMVEERTQSINQYAIKLEKISMEDALTGLHNRRFFEHEYDKEWRRAQRRKESVAIIMIDVDYLKQYNDFHGHLSGDACLQAVAHAIKNQLRRAGDFVARFGGEEFVAVVPGANLEAAYVVAERMREAVLALGISVRPGASALVTISLGIASIMPAQGMAADALVNLADQAMYCAKNSGRNISMRSVVPFSHADSAS